MCARIKSYTRLMDMPIYYCATACYHYPPIGIDARTLSTYPLMIMRIIRMFTHTRVWPRQCLLMSAALSRSSFIVAALNRYSHRRLSSDCGGINSSIRHPHTQRQCFLPLSLVYCMETTHSCRLMSLFSLALSGGRAPPASGFRTSAA